MRLGWSSHVYPLEAADFADVPDYAGAPIPEQELPPDRIVLLIRPGCPDALVRGREEIARHAGGVVDVRVVFEPSVARWNLPGTLVRVCRNRYRYHGTHVYHISAASVRKMKLERAIRTMHNPHGRDGEDRALSMARLLESLKKDGYRDDRPIVVMLCRTSGLVDSLRQGHHRVSACLACGIDRMAVEFSAAGVAPWQRWGRFRRAISAAVVLLCVALAGAWAVWPKPEWVATMDVRGLPEISPVGEFRRPRFPEELSGITYVEGDQYYAVCDDGSGVWHMEIGLDRNTGIVTNCVTERNVRVGEDTEGIAWNPKERTVFVADEKTQAIHEVDPATGKIVADVSLPSYHRSRRRNRGYESLTLSPDGEFLWTANEEALSGDGDPATANEGTTVRLTRFRRSGKAWAFDGEWAYLTDTIDGERTKRMRSGVSDLCALEDGTLIVLERELSRKGVAPAYRVRLYAVRPRPSAAFDVERPVAKKLLFGADTGSANYEGVCLGPKLKNGDRTLVMVSDGGDTDDERLYSLRMSTDGGSGK